MLHICKTIKKSHEGKQILIFRHKKTQKNFEGKFLTQKAPKQNGSLIQENTLGIF